MLSPKQRQKIIDDLLLEPSDTKLAEKFNISRKTVWRLRQQFQPQPEKPMPEVIPQPVIKPESVLPKVNAEPVSLSTYFSVQILRGENFREVVEAVLTAADSLKVLFRQLQVLEVSTVGTTPFLRLRTDCTEIQRVLEAMAERSHISVDVSTANYVVKFTSGRTGKYPTSTMCTPPKLGFGQVFAGTRIQRWKQQFVNR